MPIARYNGKIAHYGNTLARVPGVATSNILFFDNFESYAVDSSLQVSFICCFISGELALHLTLQYIWYPKFVVKEVIFSQNLHIPSPFSFIHLSKYDLNVIWWIFLICDIKCRLNWNTCSHSWQIIKPSDVFLNSFTITYRYIIILIINKLVL